MASMVLDYICHSQYLVLMKNKPTNYKNIHLALAVSLLACASSVAIASEGNEQKEIFIFAPSEVKISPLTKIENKVVASGDYNKDGLFRLTVKLEGDGMAAPKEREVFIKFGQVANIKFQNKELITAYKKSSSESTSNVEAGLRKNNRVVALKSASLGMPYGLTASLKMDKTITSDVVISGNLNYKKINQGDGGTCEKEKEPCLASPKITIYSAQPNMVLPYGGWAEIASFKTDAGLTVLSAKVDQPIRDGGVADAQKQE